jgi:serine/threonine protein kinase
VTVRVLEKMPDKRYSKQGSIILSHNTETNTKVRTCVDTRDNCVRIVKIFSKTVLQRRRRFINAPSGMTAVSDWDDVLRELNLLHSLSHPNLISLVDSYETASKVKLVFPHHRCEIMTHASDGKYQINVPELYVTKVLTEIASALLYLHSSKIAHRDVKPENILVSFDCAFILSDLGSAREYSGYTTESPATPAFFPPEICNSAESPHDPFKCDIWALGLVGWCCIHRRLPYGSLDDVCILFDEIAHWDMKSDPLFALMKTGDQSQISKLLESDPALRSVSHLVSDQD